MTETTYPPGAGSPHHAGSDDEPISDVYAPFQIEERGIELIPESDRPMRPSGLFWLWAGAIWNVEFLVWGALVVSFGLSFWQAVAAILVGNVAYVMLGFASLAGPATGTTAFMVSRGSFGRNGNRLPSLFNWITQVGFEVVGIAIIVFVVEAMFAREGVTLGSGGKAAVIVVAVAIQFVMPFFGHATIQAMLRWLSYIFIVVFVVMAVLVIPHAHIGQFHQHATWWIWTTGLVLIVSVGGLGWTENAADYSRYLPRSTPTSQTFWAATLGAAIPSVLLELLGVVAYVVSSKVAGTGAAGSVVTHLPLAFAAWFFWPFMILALPQLFAINTIDMYSSGVTLQAIGIPLKRWGCVMLDTAVCGVATAFVVYHNQLNADLAGFLDYIVVWLGPWFGIMAVDYLLRKGRYDNASLAAPSGGVYWRTGGFNWKALFALGTGMVAAMMWIDAAYYYPAYSSPISNATHGADFSWLFGMVVAAVIYYVLSVGSVADELTDSDAPPAAAAATATASG